MFIRFLKKMVIVSALVFAAQGCALYVGDDDGFRHYHHHWRHGQSLQQDQVAENGRSPQTSDLDEGRKIAEQNQVRQRADKF